MKSTNPQSVSIVKTSNLKFDPENPRFYRLESGASDEKIVEEMLDDEGVQDLIASIGQKGYFPGEPLLVVGPDSDGSYTVIEGNRRLTATKLLNGELEPPARRKISISNLRNEAVVAPPFELPCLIYNDRKEILRYLGYRHITGIKEWDSLSKAKYLKQLRDDFYQGQTAEDQFRALAKDIGSRPDYVAQLLTALGLYSIAEQDHFFGLPIKHADIEFSYITTALNYKKICTWLGLDGKSDVEMHNLVVDNLRKLLAWMFVKKADGYTVLVETRNLDEIADIVHNQDAEKVLSETNNRAEAYLYTDGPSEALAKAMEDAHVKLNVVWKLLSQKGLTLTTQHLDALDAIFGLARDARNHVRDKVEE